MASRLIKSVLFFLALSTQVIATDKGPCIQSCFTDHPYNAGCDGTETGAAAIDACTCTGYHNVFATSAFICVGDCPVSEQKTFFDSIPDACRAYFLAYYSGPGGSSEPSASSTTHHQSTLSTSSVAVETTTESATTTTPATGASITVATTTSASPSMSATPNAASGMEFNTWNAGIMVGGVAIMVL